MSKIPNKFASEVRARAIWMMLDHEADYLTRWVTVVSIDVTPWFPPARIRPGSFVAHERGLSNGLRSEAGWTCNGFAPVT